MQGLRNEVIVQKTHHYDYDHAIRDCGARFIDVETLDEYERAFTERTVMTQFFNAAEGGRIGREDWVRVAHKHGVPRSEEHTSELQSRLHLVCRLPLEKKKQDRGC